MLILDVSTGSGPGYTLECWNYSKVNWFFYVYQKMTEPLDSIFSLACLVSPCLIRPDSFSKFVWTTDYCFVWYGIGELEPGVNFNIGGEKPCSPNDKNKTTFNLDGSAPGLSEPTSDPTSDKLIIEIAGDVPDLMYSSGIGMSGQGTFVQQSSMNVQQQYCTDNRYWVAAAAQMKMGQVLSQTINNTMEFHFPQNVYTLTASIGQDNKWTITSDPGKKKDSKKRQRPGRVWGQVISGCPRTIF